MHVLVTNDDGQPDPYKSPFVRYLIKGLANLTDWKVSVCVPSSQKSWISKAHLPSKTLTASFIYSKIQEPCDYSFEGPFDKPNLELKRDKDLQEICLIDGTPSSCTDIGLHHIYNDTENPIDLVISGPNYGRNTTAVYIMSSGTIGAAIESCLSGVKSVGLSFAFDTVGIEESSIHEGIKISVNLIKHLMNNWKPEVDLYSVNVPLSKDLKYGKTKIFYAPILENRWGSLYTSCSSPARIGFKEDFHEEEKEVNPVDVPSEESSDGDDLYVRDKIQFRWDPDYEKYFKTVVNDQDQHHDGKLLELGHVSVTAMKSVFSNYNYRDEIVLE